jgi:ABC-type transport system involved in multi-copper enzyme maturation permease subunit
MRTFSVARMTFHEARMRKVLWALALLGILFLAVYATGFRYIYRDLSHEMADNTARIMEPVNFFMLAGLYAVNFLVVLMAVSTSVDTIAGEVASGTIQTIVSKPLRRWEVLLGKWLGLALMLGAFSALMTLALMGIVRLISGYWPPNAFRGAGLIVLEGLVVLSLSILGGTRLPTLTNAVVVFMLYGLAFMAGWIEQIGSYLRSEAAVNFGIIVSLLMPSEAMWKRAAYLMQPPFLRELGFEATPFGAATAPSGAMVVYTIGFVIVIIALAVRSFQLRDL